MYSRNQRLITVKTGLPDVSGDDNFRHFTPPNPSLASSRRLACNARTPSPDTDKGAVAAIRKWLEEN